MGTYILSETIEPETGIIVQNRAWGDLADWLSPEYDKTDKSLLWECYFIYDLEIMREVATLLGFDEEFHLPGYPNNPLIDIIGQLLWKGKVKSYIRLNLLH